MKILHVVGESKFGGGSVMIHALATKAVAQGWTVDVLTTDATLAKLLHPAGVGVISIDAVRRAINPVHDVRGLWRLYRFLKKHPYTVVHTHTSKGGFIGRLAARLARIPAVVHTAHGFAFHEASHPVALRCYTFLERMAAGWCDRIVTVSEFHRHWGLALGIGKEQKIVAIPNGIAPDRVESTRSREQVRAEFGTPPGGYVLLSTGRLAAGKGLEDLLEAAAHLRRTQPRPVVLWLAGDGPLRPRLQQRVTELGLDDVVHFLGFRGDIGDLLSASDVVALPSLREGLSIALLEAMAAGKPIVATAIGSNREVTRNGEAARLIPPSDPDALAQAIAEIMADPELAERLGSTAGLVYRSAYTERRMLDRYVEEYRRVLTECSEARSTRSDAGAKRLLDIAVAGAALILVSPLLAATALAIQITSPGPTLFRQKRLGRNGSIFTLYKFRTMIHNAPDVRNADGSTYSAGDDPRITSVGRFLRTTSLDELPQLINVLKGEMSLVGPRPELPDQIDFYSDSDKQRLHVRPGLTGLAQLSGRNELPWEQRRQLDVDYVSRRSLWMDIKLLVRTVPYVLRRRGIYSPATRKESLQ